MHNSMQDQHSITSGFHVIHGNHLEDLRTLVVDWIRATPLPPLENETILVQSNGISQWLKLALAESGVAMGLDVTLPARLQWQLYRRVPGGTEIPRHAPYDTDQLVWRLMRILPELLYKDEFESLRIFLRDDQDVRKRYQLALRIADLFDQYQVYRGDWLTAWAQGTDQGPDPFPDDQLWQPILWRAVRSDMPTDFRETDRGSIHEQFMRYLQELSTDPGAVPAGFPRRVIVFGISSMASQMIQVLHGVSSIVQVVWAVQNPCRYYWADIVDHREFFRDSRRRRRRPGNPASAPAEEDLHLYAHPLLSAWGMQARDYIAMLDELEQQGSGSDVFRSPGSETLLNQLQDDILELRPLGETRDRPLPDSDSLVFHVAHSALREVEILHDQLLDAFDRDAELRPRDIMVMVPDIARYTPLIAAVFGRLERDDPRYIPFTVSDQGLRGLDPIVTAVEFLLDLPYSRITVEDVLSLLDTPALRRKFGVEPEERETLLHWVTDAGVRWGIDATQRRQFDLPAGIDQNTWRFGLDRLLLGYARGDDEVWNGIVGYPGIGGGDAPLLGRIVQLVDTLDWSRTGMDTTRTPHEWVVFLRAVIEQCFEPVTDAEQQVVDLLLGALLQWEEACRSSDFAEEIPVAVVRDGWLSAVDAPRLTQRFFAGAVNIATLMPMRAIPFKMVCLLGMNDGDYPRSLQPVGFDLMQRPGEYRPGDRSRREDDRYLFLEALLAARRRFYISWVGRSISDNSVRPPSVLVGRLRDHIDGVWSAEVWASDALTTYHPLQPFSGTYVDDRTPLFTYVHEWFLDQDTGKSGTPHRPPSPVTTGHVEIGLREIDALVRDPLAVYFTERLGFRFDSVEDSIPCDEPFVLNNLEAWQIRDRLLEAMRDDPERGAEAHLHRILSGGLAPVAPFSRLLETQVLQETRGVLQRFHAERDDVVASGNRNVRVQAADGDAVRIELVDTIPEILETREGVLKRVEATASRIHDGKGSYRWDKLVYYWPTHLAAQLSGDGGGRPVFSTIVGLHGTITIPPLAPERARTILADLIAMRREALQTPPAANRAAGCAWVAAGGSHAPDKARDAAFKVLVGRHDSAGEYGKNRYLRRAWPDVDQLLDSVAFGLNATRLYGPLIDLWSGA